MQDGFLVEARTFDLFGVRRPAQQPPQGDCGEKGGGGGGVVWVVIVKWRSRNQH
jgi:hypothetical protein